MKGHRIDFLSVDAARFNALRDQWRDVACGCVLPKVSYKIAPLLHGYVSREYGYAFPTDEQLAAIAKCSTRLIGKGLGAMEEKGLIERQTIVRRDAKGEAAGRMRRIYLTMPGERNTLPEVNGTQVNGTPEVNGTKRASERNTEFRIYPDKITPDKVRNDHGKLGAMPAWQTVPSVYRKDPDFLEAFDRQLVAAIDGRAIGAGELESIVQRAFDAATDSRGDFMPVHWPETCRDHEHNVANAFRQRAGQLIHRHIGAAA